MPQDALRVRATLKLRHERPYDYDERRGLWLYQRLDDDEEYGNIVTNAGRVTLHTFIYGTTAQRVSAALGTGFNFIALTNDAVPTAASDTSLAAELSSNGLQRVQGSVALPTGSGTITRVQNVFTYSGGGTQGIQKTALFDAASGGNMAHEILFTQRTLSTSDTLTIAFNITLA